MAAPSLDRQPTAAGFAPVLLANAFPLVGVVLLGWDPATLAVVYALEVLFSFPVASVKALFAQRPPRADGEDGAGVLSVDDDLVHKRGRVEVVPWLPPVYPRTVPFAVVVLETGVWFGFVVTVVLAAAVPVGSVLTRPAVAVGVAALVAGQAVETWRTYVRERRYETVTPYTVVETPARQTFFLVFVLLVVPAGATDATVALGALVVVKLLVEWAGYRTSRGGGGRLTDWLAGPEATGEDPDPVAVPDGDPDARVQTDGRAVLWTGALDTFVRVAPFYVAWAVVVWLVTLSVLGGAGASPALGAGIALAVVGVYAALFAARTGLFYLRYGPLEYRRHGDRLVAYDTLVAEPQWAVPTDALRDATVVSDRLTDRVLGTRTVAVTTGWGEEESRRYLGPVADGDALVSALSLPVGTTGLAPMDRRVVAGVVACVVTLGAVGVASAVAGWTDVLLPGVFGLPFVAVGLQWLWGRAYPDRTE